MPSSANAWRAGRSWVGHNTSVTTPYTGCVQVKAANIYQPLVHDRQQRRALPVAELALRPRPGYPAADGEPQLGQLPPAEHLGHLRRLIPATD
jgi:hypothetical protein